MAGKGAETALGILGSVFDLAGPLLLGPEAVGMPFGNPFRAAGDAIRNKREQQNLIDTLSSFPETQGLVGLGNYLSQNGGLAGVLGPSATTPGEIGGIPVGPHSVPVVSGASIIPEPLSPENPVLNPPGVPSTLDQALKMSPTNSQSPLRDIIKYHSQQNNLDPALVTALISQESGGNPNVVSHAGAIGDMQLMPGTARELNVNPHDRNDNIKGGTRYLRQMIDMFDGSVPLGLAAYNSGPGNVRKAGGNIPNIKETQNYVPSVLNKMGRPDLLNSLRGAEGGAGNTLSSVLASRPGKQRSEGSQNIGNLPVSFLKKAAESGVLDMDTFRKIIFAQAQQKPDDNSDFIEKLLLQRERSQDRADQAALNNQYRQDNMQIFNSLMMDRQKGLTEFRQSFPTSAQQEELGKIDSMLTGLRSLPNEVPGNITGPIAAAKIPIVGPYMLTKQYPELAALDKQLKSIVASKSFIDGGKNLTAIEKDMTFGTAPSLLEAPEFYPLIKKNYEARIRLIQLSSAFSMSRIGKKDVSASVSNEELDNYGLFREALRQDGRKALSDPAMKELMGELGIDGLTIDFKKK